MRRVQCFCLLMCENQALEILDEEKSKMDNKFCKVLLNVAPFDGVVAGVRNQTVSNQKFQEFEGWLKNVSTNEKYTAVK